MNEEKICFALKITGVGCSCLTGEEECNGLNDKCKFHKTRKEFVEASDNAIEICRAKNMCVDCKYMKTDAGRLSKPCKKSTEVLGHGF